MLLRPILRNTTEIRACPVGGIAGPGRELLAEFPECPFLDPVDLRARCDLWREVREKVDMTALVVELGQLAHEGFGGSP